MSGSIRLPPAPRVNFLVVQADPAELEETVNALAEHCGRESIAIARDGVEALDYLLCRAAHAGRDVRRQPRLVLLDPKLPRLEASEVIRTLRSNPWTRSVPVAVWTQGSPRQTLQAFYAQGANSVVVKTREPGELRRKMREIHDFWILVNQAERHSRV